MKNLTNNLTIWINGSLLMMGFLFSGTAISESNIGRVVHTNGDLVASNNGATRTLKRGSYISEGDVVNSGATSKSQLRMMDGALIVLRQNSEMHFEEYKYDKKDKSVGSSVFSLIKGGFKTISGLIGKQNKKNYKVKTAFTTIGIRGTDYGVTICEQSNCSDGDNGTLNDGLYASVIDGEISSKNEAGLYTFSNDEYFYVASKSSEPESLLKAPGVIFDPNIIGNNTEMNANNEYVSLLTDNSLGLGAAIQANADLQNIAAYNDTVAPTFISSSDISSNATMVSSNLNDTMMFSYVQDIGGISPNIQTLVDDGTIANQFILNAIAAENGDFIPLAASISDATLGTSTLYIANATANDIGSTNLGGTDVSWGRWSGDLYEVINNGTTTTHTGSLHYAVINGGLTTPAQISAMAGMGTFNYTTIGGTNATDLNGNVAANVADVNMTIDFNLQTINSFSVATNVAGIDYQAEMQSPTTTIAITDAISNGMTLAGNSAGTCPGCGGVASLGLIGVQAEGAVTNYSIGNIDTSTNITGTTILAR